MQFWRKILFSFVIFVVVANPTLASFDDAKNELIPEVIEFLQSKGVGQTSDNFYPKRPITLAEFVSMGLAAAGIKDLPSNATTRFKDVPAAAWFAPAIAEADARGILNDSRGDNLLPNRPINRAEATALSLKIFGIAVPPTLSDEDFSFRDVNKSYRLARFIFRAVKMGVINPIADDEFGTTQRFSRGEAANLFYNLANFSSEEGGGTIIIQNGLSNIPGWPLFETVWDETTSKFLFQDKLNQTKMLHSAIQGMIESLGDPYSEFYTPEQTQLQTGNLSGEVEGIGVYIEKDEQGRGLVIVAPIYNSPAEKAGLLPGDIITAVDGQPLAGLPLEDAANLTRGPNGTTARYKILRNGNEFEVEIRREKIKLDITSVAFKNQIAIVDINQFTASLPTDFAKIAAQITEQRPRGIIIDLRNDGGGLVNAAVDLLGYFLPKGTVVATQEFRDGSSTDYKTLRDPSLSGIRTVVLVNKGSASASEIVAAALQDTGAASVVGEQTFGKGTVQEINFFQDGTALKLTVAHWLSPKRQQIQGNGVKPDFPGVDNPDTPVDEGLESALSLF
ncbi:MAG: S41 family peptidase [Patescibacteria group bacterium]